MFVAIDGQTASASEQFATLLQYNDAATIVGEKSYGAGWGAGDTGKTRARKLVQALESVGTW